MYPLIEGFAPGSPVSRRAITSFVYIYCQFISSIVINKKAKTPLAGPDGSLNTLSCKYRVGEESAVN